MTQDVTTPAAGAADGGDSIPRLREIFAPLADLLRERLGDQLYGLLIHGSSVRDLDHADDFDLIFALRRPSVASVRAIRESLAELTWDRPLEVQIVCVSQIPAQSDYFTLKAGGPFLLYRLRGALILAGDNPYLHVDDPSQESVRRSLLAEVQRNVWFARHAAGQGAAELTDHEIYHVAKKMWWNIKDVLMWVGKERPDLVGDFHEACALFPAMIGPTERDWLTSILDLCGRERELFEPLSVPERDAFLERVLAVHEAAYRQLVVLAERDLGLPFHADGALSPADV